MYMYIYMYVYIYICMYTCTVCDLYVCLYHAISGDDRKKSNLDWDARWVF